MEDYSLANLRPSDVSWLNKRIVIENVMETLNMRISNYLSHDTKSVASLDTFYSSGVELSSIILNNFSKQDIAILRAIPTNPAKVFFDGIDGKPFDV